MRISHRCEKLPEGIEIDTEKIDPGGDWSEDHKLKWLLYDPERDDYPAIPRCPYCDEEFQTDWHKALEEAA